MNFLIKRVVVAVIAFVAALKLVAGLQIALMILFELAFVAKQIDSRGDDRSGSKAPIQRCP